MPEKAVGTKHGAPYCGWPVTHRAMAIRLTPWIGLALIVLLSRGLHVHITGSLLP
jgi:hypothetical protein